jgi:hypothetical protein
MARQLKSEDGTDRRGHDRGSLVISQMGWGDLARPCTRLGRAQLWRRRWSRRRAINRSVTLQRGQWSVWSCARGAASAHRRSRRNAAGCRTVGRTAGRRGSGKCGNQTLEGLAEAVNGVALGALSSEAVDANGRSVGADRQTMQGYEVGEGARHTPFRGLGRGHLVCPSASDVMFNVASPAVRMLLAAGWSTVYGRR